MTKTCMLSLSRCQKNNMTKGILGTAPKLMGKFLPNNASLCPHGHSVRHGKIKKLA